MKERLPQALSAVFLAVIVACSSGSSGGDSDTAGLSQDLGGDVGIGGSEGTGPPSMDSLLESTPVHEQQTVTIEPDGGQINLSTNGMRVEVPPGALPIGSELTVYRHRFDDEPEGFWQDVYRFECEEQPAADITVVFPIPGPAEGAEAARTNIIWFHELDAPVMMERTIDEVGRTATVITRTFSSAIVDASAPLVPTMEAIDTVMQVPYYNQGASENCWSMALNMLMGAYGADVEPWDNNAFFNLPEEDGLYFIYYAHTRGIVNHIRSFLPDIQIERKTWWTTGGFDSLETYLRENMLKQRPTMVYYYADESGASASHMVLFVGLDGDQFVIHDPQRDGYMRVSWDLITPRFSTSGFDGTATLCFKTSPPEPSWDATVWAPFPSSQGEGIDFASIPYRWDSVIKYRWYVKELDGPGLVDVNDVVVSVPLDYYANLIVQAANAVEGSPRRPFMVTLDVIDTSSGAVVSERDQTVELRGGEDLPVEFSSLGTALAICDLVPGPGQYVFEFNIWDSTASQSYDGFRIDIAVRGGGDECQDAPSRPLAICNGSFENRDYFNCGSEECCNVENGTYVSPNNCWQAQGELPSFPGERNYFCCYDSGIAGQDGDCFVEPYVDTGIQQNLETTPGESYTIDFLAAAPDDEGPYSLTVSAGEQTQPYEISQMTWTPLSFTFTAEAASTSLLVAGNVCWVDGFEVAE